jgi:hypothetical protein
MSYLLIGMFMGAIIGIVIAALTLSSKRSSDNDHALGHALDAARLDYLDRSECSLLFNPQFNLWGMLDARDKPFAAGETARAALDKARAQEQAEMQVPA